MKKIILSVVIISAILPSLTYAAQTTGSNAGASATGSNPPIVSQPVTLENPLAGANSLTELFFKILNFILGFAYAIIAFFLILSGFKFVVAQGSEDKLKDAKNTFKYTIIGAILIIGAQTIVSVVKGIMLQL